VNQNSLQERDYKHNKAIVDLFSLMMFNVPDNECL